MNTLVDTWVPTELLDVLDERFTKIAKRAARINFPVPVLDKQEKVIGTAGGHNVTPLAQDEVELCVRAMNERYAQGERDIAGEIDRYRRSQRPVVWQHIVIAGEPLKLGDYRLVASIDPLEITSRCDGIGNNPVCGYTGEHNPHEMDGGTVAFFRPVLGETVPEEWREVDPSVCQHCNVRRYRTETFLVCKGNGYVQVGRNCIRDFLGHDPGNLIPFLRLWDDLVGWFDGDSEGGWGARISPTYSVEEVINVAARVVAVDGFYISRSKAETDGSNSTGNIVRELLEPPRNIWDEQLREQYSQPAYMEQADKIAAATIEELQKLTSSADNDWKYNLWAAFNAKQLTARHVGIAASSVILGLRVLEDRTRAAASGNSEWVGQIGNKLSTQVTVTDMREFDSGYGGSSGRWGYIANNSTYLVTMKDQAGNVIKWFASNPSDEVEVDKTFIIKGTVKKHDEYRGQKQTILTRCKMIGA